MESVQSGFVSSSEMFSAQDSGDEKVSFIILKRVSFNDQWL